LGAELQELCTQPWAREGGVGAVRILQERLPTAGPALRCAIVHSLGILAHERSNLALMRAYDDADAAGRTARCPSIGLSMRPDGDLSDRIDLLQPEESFALKIVLSMAQMRATSPEIRRHVEPWLRARIDDETREADFRESARALLDGIEQGRDDRQAKSVDEALGIAPPD
jgi:hypothetical protein